MGWWMAKRRWSCQWPDAPGDSEAMTTRSPSHAPRRALLRLSGAGAAATICHEEGRGTGGAEATSSRPPKVLIRQLPAVSLASARQPRPGPHQAAFISNSPILFSGPMAWLPFIPVRRAVCTVNGVPITTPELLQCRAVTSKKLAGSGHLATSFRRSASVSIGCGCWMMPFTSNSLPPTSRMKFTVWIKPPTSQSQIIVVVKRPSTSQATWSWPRLRCFSGGGK
mmetsp:Transcript_23544/g.54679  ORF Transcript_23544/g.54679 Transcript_23544/m.54679 type:complete len:224 (+) Transcript_23544:539-1210(+)